MKNIESGRKTENLIRLPLFILLVFFTCIASGQQRNGQLRKTTIHVKSPYARKSGKYISKYCIQSNESFAIFISKNGDAYLYWVITLPSGSYGWDSLSISSDSAEVNKMNSVITSTFIDSVKTIVKDSACDYIVGIRENGVDISKIGIAISFMDNSEYFIDKIKPLIVFLEEKYKEIGSPK